MKKVKQDELNLFILAMNFANRQAEKINNANIVLNKLKNEKDSKSTDIKTASDRLESENKKLEKYNSVVDLFDEKYFG